MATPSLSSKFDSAVKALTEVIAQLEGLRADQTQAGRDGSLSSVQFNHAPEVTRNLSIAITDAESAKLRVQHAAWKLANG